jgi:hypothetical protein
MPSLAYYVLDNGGGGQTPPSSEYQNRDWGHLWAFVSGRDRFGFHQLVRYLTGLGRDGTC